MMVVVDGWKYELVREWTSKRGKFAVFKLDSTDGEHSHLEVYEEKIDPAGRFYWAAQGMIDAEDLLAITDIYG